MQKDPVAVSAQGVERGGREAKGDEVSVEDLKREHIGVQADKEPSH